MLEERGFGDDYGRRNRSLLQVCDNMGGRGVFSFWNKFGRHGRSLARKDGYSYDSHEVKHVVVMLLLIVFMVLTTSSFIEYNHILISTYMHIKNIIHIMHIIHTIHITHFIHIFHLVSHHSPK